MSFSGRPDPSQTVEQLLNDLYDAAQRGQATVGYALGHSSALNAKVAGLQIQAVDRLTATIKDLDERNGRLQRSVAWLTWAAVVLAVVQVVLAGFAYLYPLPSSGVGPATIAQPHNLGAASAATR